MRLAIGLILSPGYTPPPEFWLGRPEAPAPEGLIALLQRLGSGTSNQSLPPDRRLTGYRMITSRCFPTDIARNDICASVLAGDEDYLLFLDCDMTHPAILAERLIGHDKPVITARYHMKKAPWNPVMYVKHRVVDGAQAFTSVHFGRGVFEVERGGAGALLIRRDVLDAMARADGHNWFRYQRADTPPHDFTVSEDFHFWARARALGFSTWADWDCVCGHLTTQAIDDSLFEASVDRQGVEALQAGGEVLAKYRAHAVVCGYPDGLVLPDGSIVPPYQIEAGR